MSENEITLDDWQYWYSRVYAYFYKRVNGMYEVEELTSQTLNTAFMAKNVLNFKAYTWKVAHNYLVKYIQTKNLDPMPISWDENVDLASASIPKWQMEQTFETQTSEQYQNKLSQLLECIRQNVTKPDDYKILEMSICEEKNSVEIAAIVGLSSDNVRQKLSRNIKKLRQSCVDLWKHLIAK